MTETENQQYLLSHLRVVDLSMGWSGPLCARHLGDMGAEIIKVESIQYLDWWRGWDLTPEAIQEKMYEQSSAFNLMNRNKKDITLDLTRPEGTDILKRLVRISDVVVENQSFSVLPKLGLGYDDLKKENESIIMISMPAFGCTGDISDYRAYGSTVEHASGLPHLTGEADWPPTMQHVAYGDPVAGLNALAAVMAALWHKQKTGQGQFIDLSQVECLFTLASHGIIEQSLTGNPPARHGSRHKRHAPHGVYPCAAENSWVTITITTDEEWLRFCQTIGLADLIDDTELMNEKNRKDREDEIDAHIKAWTARRDPAEIMTMLQENDVTAARVRPAFELIEDEQLSDRGFFDFIERQHVGFLPIPRAPYIIPKGMKGIQTPSPTVGQHNHEILSNILGLSEQEITDLEEKGIIGDLPISASEENPEI